MATAARPSTAAPASSVTGAKKRSPEFGLRASRSVGVPPASLYQATATVSPAAASAGPATGQASIFQPSAWTGLGAVHAPFSSRVTAMSRTSSSLRSRYASSGPRAVIATAVWQQSQARASSCASAPRFRLMSKRLARSWVAPACPAWSPAARAAPSCARPSSQAMPAASAPSAHSAAKPCSTGCASSLTRVIWVQAMPPSRERASTRS